VGAEPVVLRRTGGASPHAHVCGAVHDVSDDVVHEQRVVRHDRGREPVIEAREQLDELLEARVVEFGENLDGSEDLGGDELSRRLVLEDGLQRHEDRRWLERAVAFGDVVPREFLATEQEFGAFEFAEPPDVIEHLSGSPAEDGSDGEVLK